MQQFTAADGTERRWFHRCFQSDRFKAHAEFCVGVLTMCEESTALLVATQRYSRLKPLRESSHPVLDRILLERDDFERLTQFCRALLIFEELETVLRDEQRFDRQKKVETLLSDLDDMRSRLPALSGIEVCSKCLKIDEAK